MSCCSAMLSTTAIQTPNFSMTLIYDNSNIDNAPTASNNDKKRKTSPVSEEEDQSSSCCSAFSPKRKSIKVSTSSSPNNRKIKSNGPRVESPKHSSSAGGCNLNAIHNQELLTSVYSIEQNIKECLSELKGMEEFGFSSEIGLEFEQAFSMLH